MLIKQANSAGNTKCILNSHPTPPLAESANWVSIRGGAFMENASTASRATCTTIANPLL